MMTRTAQALCILSLGIPLLLPCPAARADDWFRWRGPDLNGISKETGWLCQWPDEGPKQLWKASVGTGFSSMSVSHGRLYTMGNDGQDTDTVFCFDAVTGAQIWKHSYHCALDPKYYEGGTSSTPTVDGDRIYTLSRKGDLFCFDAVKGHVNWSKNVHSDLGNEIPTWGFAGSPLVEGDLLVLNVGTAGTALDKKTGKVIWHSDTGVSGYATPVPFNSGKDRVIAIFASQTIEVLHPKDGKPVWNFPWKTQYDVNAADPIISGGKMFISSGYGRGCALLDISGDKPSVVWENKNLRNHINSSVLWQGYLYGMDDISNTKYELKCISLETGELKWSEPKFGKGSLIIADGKIIGLSDKGELMVADGERRRVREDDWRLGRVQRVAHSRRCHV